MFTSIPQILLTCGFQNWKLPVNNFNWQQLCCVKPEKKYSWVILLLSLLLRLLNSHYTQHYSASWLTSCEIILLSPNTTFHWCSKLQPVTLLPEKSDINDDKYDSTVLTDNFLSPRIDLWETLWITLIFFSFFNSLVVHLFKDIMESIRLVILSFLQC